MGAYMTMMMIMIMIMMVMMMILTYIMLQESILQYSLVLFMCAKQSGKEILDTVVF